MASEWYGSFWKCFMRSWFNLTYEVRKTKTRDDVKGIDYNWQTGQTHNWQKWKSIFLTCPWHGFYKEEAVCLKNVLILYFKNYEFCEYVKFGTISWTFDILSITALLKLEYIFEFEFENKFIYKFILLEDIAFFFLYTFDWRRTKNIKLELYI